MEGTYASLDDQSSKVWPQSFGLASKAMNELRYLLLKLLFCTTTKNAPFVSNFFNLAGDAGIFKKIESLGGKKNYITMILNTISQTLVLFKIFLYTVLYTKQCIRKQFFQLILTTPFKSTSILK